jgi:hypothetical protein
MSEKLVDYFRRFSELQCLIGNLVSKFRRTPLKSLYEDYKNKPSGTYDDPGSDYRIINNDIGTHIVSRIDRLRNSR